MNWYTFLAISILGETFGRVLQRFILRDDKSNPIAYIIWFQFIAGCMLLVFSLFNGIKLPKDPISILPNLLLVPILYSFGGILIFKSLQLIEASVFTILFNSRVIIVILGAIFFLKNSFSLTQVLGTILILASIAAISFKKNSMQFRKGEMYTILAGMLIAIGTINDSIILKKFDPISYTAYGFFAPMILNFLLNLKSTKQILSFPKTKTFPKIFLLSAFFGTAFLTYNMAFISGQNAATIAAIFPVSSILTVLISIILLKERQNLALKIIAALVSFIGILLVT